MSYVHVFFTFELLFFFKVQTETMEFTVRIKHMHFYFNYDISYNFDQITV